MKEHDSIIGETLLKINDKITTVLAKDSGHEGVFRTQKMRLLAGEDKRIGLHKENGVVLEVNVEDVYFSLRLSTERKRIMELVKPGEDILVCFSGAGPYTCVLGKNTEALHVTGIEINPAGHALAEKNIVRNKLHVPVGRVSTYCGDVREKLPEVLAERRKQDAGFTGYDRILMPLPKNAETFLEAVLEGAHSGTIIHFYVFLHEDKLAEAYTWISAACAEKGMSHKILETVKCGQQAPHVYRYCIDFRLE
jgi:tRNA (guanine37-N1)-methyltransferase